MKRNVVRLMMVLAVAAVTIVATSSQAEAGLFGGRGGGRFFGGRHGGCGGCEATCEPAPVCCEPAPADCGCNNGCGHRSGGFFGRFRNRGPCGCDSGCNNGCGGTVIESAPATPPAAPAAPAGGAAPAAPGGGA